MIKYKKTFIVAEIGSNHNNDFSTAKKLISIAKKCGADAVKFQLFEPSKLYNKNDFRFKILTKFKLNPDWIKKLKKFCDSNKIIFFASPFDKNSVDLLTKNKIKILKIASPEIRDDLLIDYIARKKVFTILSTGVSTLKEISKAKSIINKYHNNLAILQCSSIYPCDLKNINLKVIKTYLKKFNNIIGFSDHSLSIYPPISAVSLGAKIIEKHFTINRNQKGPDHSISIEPTEFKKMVEGIRIVEKSLGVQQKKILGRESLKNHKKSFFASREINKNEKISKDNVNLLRYSSGILSSEIKKVFKKRAKKIITKGKKIQWAYLK